MSEQRTHITNQIKSQFGGDESARLYVITTIHSGETEVVIEKTLTKRMPIQHFKEAERLYERLTGGGGRRVYTLDDLVDEKIG